MEPRLPATHSGDKVATDSIFLPKLFMRVCSVFAKLSYFNNLFCRKFCPVPSFIHHVFVVVLDGSKEKMIWVNTPLVVAPVKNRKIRKRSMGNFPCNSVGCDCSSCSIIDLPVSATFSSVLSSQCSSPIPAFTRWTMPWSFINFCPVPFFKWSMDVLAMIDLGHVTIIPRNVATLRL